MKTKELISKIKNRKKELGKKLEIEHAGKTILPLKQSLCPNMFKINLKNLLYTLNNIGKVNIINVKNTIKKDAKLALDRMLTL